MFSVKNVLSAIAAIFVAVLVLSLFIKMVGVALSILFNITFLVIIAVLALPLYVIFKKKLFK